MVDRGEPAVDLAGLVVPLAGRLVATGDRWEPYQLLDSGGVPVEAARLYFGHLQAAGRPEPTVRSYGLDLLRWFRFLWAAGVCWDQATRAEARDFCRWLVVAGKPVRPHWREQRLGLRAFLGGHHQLAQVFGVLVPGVDGLLPHRVRAVGVVLVVQQVPELDQRVQRLPVADCHSGLVNGPQPGGVLLTAEQVDQVKERRLSPPVVC
jgi:hypothetical protein